MPNCMFAHTANQPFVRRAHQETHWARASKGSGVARDCLLLFAARALFEGVGEGKTGGPIFKWRAGT